jgi:hypothetical protein
MKSDSISSEHAASLLDSESQATSAAMRVRHALARLGESSYDFRHQPHAMSTVAIAIAAQLGSGSTA